MNIMVFRDKAEIDNEVASYIKKRISGKPNIVLGLATGSTPQEIYRKLVEFYRNGEISFRDVVTFNLDEYVGLPPMHPQSYRHYMNANLFSQVDIDFGNTYFPGEYEGDYDLLIASRGGIDLQLLGIGANGHIAFNEPDTPFTSLTHETELDLKTRMDNSRFFNSIEEVPTKAMTMGIGSIMSSKEIILIAHGKNKAEAVKAMVEGAVDPSCPASILQNHVNVTVYLDEEAASMLDRE